MRLLAAVGLYLGGWRIDTTNEGFVAEQVPGRLHLLQAGWVSLLALAMLAQAALDPALRRVWWVPSAVVGLAAVLLVTSWYGVTFRRRAVFTAQQVLLHAGRAPPQVRRPRRVALRLEPWWARRFFTWESTGVIRIVLLLDDGPPWDLARIPGRDEAELLAGKVARGVEAVRGGRVEVGDGALPDSL